MVELPEVVVGSVRVRIGDSLSVPIGTSTFLCVYMGDRWCIHETEDDKLTGMYFLPHVLIQTLVNYAQKKSDEREAQEEPDIGLVKKPEPTAH